MTANKRVWEVLQQLLEKIPDPNKLEKLLKPENLLILLQLYGRDNWSIRQELAVGKLPGEFLLELLDQEPNADRLLAQLGITSEKQPQQTTAPSNPLELKARRRGNLFGSHYTLVVITIIALSSIMPALIVAGFLPPISVTYETASLIALVGGAIAGAISKSDAILSWKGMAVGIVYSLATLWATIFYTQSRTSIFRIEIVIPMLVGGIPAVIVYYLLSKFSKIIAPH